MMKKEAILALSKKPAVYVSAASVLAGSAGAILGYHVARKQLTAEFQQITEQEIAEAKRYYAEQRVVQEVKPSPQEILDRVYSEEAKEAREAMEIYMGGDEHLVEPAVGPDTPVSPEGKLITEAKLHSVDNSGLIDDTDPETNAALQEDITGRRGNIFAGKDPVKDEAEWDYEAELRIREENPDKPFIIHHDEFYENETDYVQDTLTYYEGDDTLADEKDVPVPDEEAVVGEDALTTFGHGSKDKNIVYVRNERLETDFEIVRSNGKYSVEVLGLDDTENELRHSYTRHPNRKFRPERDD